MKLYESAMIMFFVKCLGFDMLLPRNPYFLWWLDKEIVLEASIA